MKSFLTFLFLFVILHEAKSQGNLVPNPSFENYSSCPTSNSQLFRATPWTNPNSLSPDFYDTCSTNYDSSVPHNWPGYQNGHSGGGGYAGIAIDWGANEYFQVKLLDTLVAGKKYCVGFYVCLAGRSDYASNGPQLIFSDTSIYSPSAIHFIYPPQISTSTIISDTLNWTYIYGEYISTGAEQYIIIGDFNDVANTPMDSVGNNNWQLAYYYIDDVSVVDCGWSGISSTNSASEISLFPSVNDGNMTLSYVLPENQKGKFIVFDVLGNIVSQIILTNGSQQQNINLSQLSAGSYYYQVTFDDILVKSDRIIISK